MPHFVFGLTALHACPEAIAWAQAYDDPQEAWETCHRGDWMMWLASRLCERKRVVRAACQCARLALPHATSGVAIASIETTERWCEGEATIEDVIVAADNADESDDNSRTAASWAVRAAALAAETATDSDDTPDAPWYTAEAVAYAAAYAAAVHASATAAEISAVFRVTLVQCADLVRKEFPACPQPKEPL